MAQTKFYSKHSRYAAKIMKSGQLIYTSLMHDRENEAHTWFTHDEPVKDITSVMDNKQFNRMLADGEVEMLPSTLQS